MKKEIKITPQKRTQKVTLEKVADMLEKLATFTVDNAEKMGIRISSLEQGQVRLEQGQEEIKQEVSSLKTDHKDTNQRVVSIERKLVGTQISLDETVHRAEFKKLERRVEALESQ